MNLLINIFNLVLVITCVALVFLVLMQRAKTDGAVGSALGGGSMESAFGAETGNVLSGATIKAAIIFFVLNFTLYLAQLDQSKHQVAEDAKLPTITAPASTAPAPAPLTVPQPTTPAPGDAKKP